MTINPAIWLNPSISNQEWDAFVAKQSNEDLREFLPLVRSLTGRMNDRVRFIELILDLDKNEEHRPTAMDRFVEALKTESELDALRFSLRHRITP